MLLENIMHSGLHPSLKTDLISFLEAQSNPHFFINF